MTEPYDLLAIGAGTAAMVASMRGPPAGAWRWSTLDRSEAPALCAAATPRRCWSAARRPSTTRRRRGKGVAGEPRVDWRDPMAFKRSFTDPVPGKNEARYAEKGIDAYRGHARFTGPDAIEVVGVGELRARRFLIATGAEPVRLGIPGEELLVDNEGFLALESLPKRILMVGGGYVAAEFSHIAAVAGSEVTILQHGDRMLKNFDPDLVGWLMPAFDRLGIDVRTGTSLEAIEKTGDGLRVRASSGGAQLAFDVELVEHAAGRAPRFDELSVQVAGIEVDGRGRLLLNEYLQSVSNPGVYAAGDAAQSGPPLTPVSSHDAKVAAANMLEGNHRLPDYRGVPSVALTLPPIASVGIGEEQARREAMKFRVKSELVPGWFTARQAAENVYGYKVLVEESTDLILGAHLVGPRVDEAINLFALAIRHGLTTEDLKSTMFAYPTGASDIGYML